LFLIFLDYTALPKSIYHQNVQFLETQYIITKPQCPRKLISCNNHFLKEIIKVILVAAKMIAGLIFVRCNDVVDCFYFAFIIL
jgi:hypothetical protein